MASQDFWNANIVADFESKRPKGKQGTMAYGGGAKNPNRAHKKRK